MCQKQALLELGVCAYSFQEMKNRNRNLKHRHGGTRGSHFQWHIGRDLCASLPSSSHTLLDGSHTPASPLPARAQGVPRPATLHCHLFHFQGRRCFSLQGYFWNCRDIFSPVIHCDLFIPRRSKDQVCHSFPGVEGCKPGGKSWWLKENRRKGFISVARTRPARWDPQAVSACFSGKVKALEIEIGLAEWGGRASGHSLEVCCGGRAKISYSLILHSRRFPAGRSHSFLP